MYWFVYLVFTCSPAHHLTGLILGQIDGIPSLYLVGPSPYIPTLTSGPRAVTTDIFYGPRPEGLQIYRSNFSIS